MYRELLFYNCWILQFFKKTIFIAKSVASCKIDLYDFVLFIAKYITVVQENLQISITRDLWLVKSS